VATDRPLDAVLEALCHALEEACPGGSAAVLLLGADGRTLHPAAAPSLPAALVRAADGLPADERGGPCGEAARGGEPVLVADVAGDRRAGAWEVAARHGLPACWGHPIPGVRPGPAARALGAVAVCHRDARPPAPWELATLAEGAHVASVAVTRARTDAALRRREQEIAALVENSPDYVARVDRGLRYLYISPSAARAVGRTPDHFLGRRLGDVACPAPLAERWREVARRAIDSGRPGELTVALPLGAETRWMHTRVAPERGPDGEVASALLVARDVTEQRRAADALAASEERYRLAMRATGDVLVDWDMATGRLTWDGAVAELLGFPAEAAGASIEWFRDRLHPEDRAAVAAEYRALGQEGRTTWASGYRFRHAGGHWVDVEAHGFVVRDAEGRATRYVGALRAARDRRGGAAAAPPAAAAPAAGDGRPWALLAEDEPGVRATVRRMLERAGYAVAEAPDGEAALALLAAAPAGAPAWALLVSDVLMPGLDGVALAARARALRPGLPIVLLSGYTADLVPGVAALPAGVEFLEKPVPSAALRDAIARAGRAAAGA
jgi:PAS domain S-box-containing protein